MGSQVELLCMELVGFLLIDIELNSGYVEAGRTPVGAANTRLHRYILSKVDENNWIAVSGRTDCVAVSASFERRVLSISVVVGECRLTFFS